MLLYGDRFLGTLYLTGGSHHPMLQNQFRGSMAQKHDLNPDPRIPKPREHGLPLLCSDPGDR